MSTFDALRHALRAQMRRPLESALLILAIALGTGVMVPLVGRTVLQARQDASLESGPELREITVQLKKDDYNSLYAGGKNLPLVEIGRVGQPEAKFKPSDLERLKAGVSGVGWAYREYFDQVNEVGNALLGKGVEVHPVTRGFLEASQLKLVAGAWPSPRDFEQKRNLLILSEWGAKKRFGQINPIGQTLTLRNSFGGMGDERYTVAAVFAPPLGNRFRSETSPFGLVALVPMGSGKGVFYEDPTLRSILLMPSPGSDLNLTQAAVRDFVAKTYGPSVSVRSKLEEQRNYHATQKAVTWVMLLFAAGGLLLAALNVTRLVLARVVATRRQTGIQAALGASSGRILGQSLLESALVGFWGGLLGLGVSLAVGLALSSTLSGGIPTAATVSSTGIFLLWTLPLGVLTSVLFGLFPAWDASRTRPAEALHS